MVNCQALSSFRAAALQDGPAVLCRHPGPEAVLFRAAAVVRLISSLRHIRSPWISPESENLEFRGKVAVLSKVRAVWRSRASDFFATLRLCLKTTIPGYLRQRSRKDAKPQSSTCSTEVIESAVFSFQFLVFPGGHSAAEP